MFQSRMSLSYENYFNHTGKSVGENSRTCNNSRARKIKENSGSMTIEAAMVLPLFLFAMMSFLSVMRMLQKSMETELKLYQTARNAAVYSAAVKEGTEGNDGDWVRLKLVYPVSGQAAGPFQKTLLLENHVNVHIFNGYSGDFAEGSDEQKEEYVYVTETGQVYHRSRNCSHLNISVRSVHGAGLGSERSADGSKYYRCPYCSRGFSAGEVETMELFVTDYGNRYHTRLDCPGLKRTIRLIPISQVGGRRPCSSCG